MFRIHGYLCAIFAGLLLGSSAMAAPHQFPQADMSKLGPVPQIDVPMYIMEYHIWYKSPFGEEAPDGYVHWDMRGDHIDRAIDPAWMRDKAPVGYPMLGLYNSEDRGVIRWQLQCMKNTGVTATFVQMFPEWNKGAHFDRTFIWDKIFKIAGEIDYKIACHDEVLFRQGQPAQDWQVMGNRLGNFVKKYGSHPAYLKVHNQPAVAFQYWNRFKGKMPATDLAKMIDLAQKVAGTDIYWIIHVAPSDGLFAMKQIDSFITMANTNALNQRVSGYEEHPKQDWDMMEQQLTAAQNMSAKHPGHDIGYWVYDGFEESPKALADNRNSFRWLKRDQGHTFMQTIERYMKHKPSFIMLTSWNDWQENTAIEPGWQSDTLDGDPYFYCKLLGKMRGVTFTPPSLPAKESVDPWMWQTLYGIDKTPPTIAHVRYMPMAPAIVATAMDTGSAIKSIKVAEHGDAYVDASDDQKPQFVGVTSIEPGRTVAGGYPLSAKDPITITLDTNLISKSKAGKLYIGLEFTDITQGSIAVYYPNAHKIINYKPGDENRFDVCASIGLSDTGQQAVAVRPMLGFLKDAKSITLTIMLKGTRKHPKPAPITVSGIHVFADMTDAKTGYRMDAGKADNQVQTHRIYINNLKTVPTQKAAYVIAEDAAGNRCMPVPYLGTWAHPFMNRP